MTGGGGRQAREVPVLLSCEPERDDGATGPGIRSSRSLGPRHRARGEVAAGGYLTRPAAPPTHAGCVRLTSVRSASRLGGVAEFEVTITDTTRTLDVPVALSEPTPDIRIQVWRGEAADGDDATDKTWQQWDEMYGSGQRPKASRIEVKPL